MQKIAPKLPRTYVLEQNFPNPFNPRTKIRFALPRSGRVQLDVFNLLGQHIVSVADAPYPAGYHTVSFDGQNLASGVYIYRLKYDNNLEMHRKMVLIK
ncbi:MAG: hypothetical protein Kow0042_23250 [Calditrichia bacterium]